MAVLGVPVLNGDVAHPTEIRTLIVDDQPDVLFLMRVMIEQANEGLVMGGEARSGKEALDRLDEDDPAVVVLDHMMPEMSGLETAAAIRARRPTQVIVLCTAYLDDRVRSQARDIGVSWCLGKENITRLPDMIRDAYASS